MYVLRATALAAAPSVRYPYTMSEHMPIDNLDAPTRDVHPLTPEGFITAAALEAFGGKLESFRQAAGTNIGQIALLADWSRGKVMRIESGSTRPSVADVWAYLSLCKVTDKNTIDTVAAEARQNRQAPLDHTYTPILSPGHRRYLEYEGIATDLSVYDSTLIPELFRTEAYAASCEKAEARFPAHQYQDAPHAALQAQLRRERAGYLLGPQGPHIRAIIEETVFYRPSEGRSKSREEQYDAVTTIIRGLQYLNQPDPERPTSRATHLNPHISVQIAPAHVNSLLRGGFPFSVTAEDGRPTAVHTEWTYREGNWSSDSDKPQAYQTDFDQLGSRIPKAAYTHAILEDILSAIQSDEPIPVVSIAAQYV